MPFTNARCVESPKPHPCVFCKDPIEAGDGHAMWQDREYNEELRRWSVTTRRAHYYCRNAKLKAQREAKR
mgnify:CR=1 FL=1